MAAARAYKAAFHTVTISRMFYLFIIAIAIAIHIAIAIAIIIWNSKTLEVMHMHINPVIYELQVSGLCP